MAKLLTTFLLMVGLCFGQFPEDPNRKLPNPYSPGVPNAAVKLTDPTLLPVLSADPAAACSEGQIYSNTTTSTIRICHAGVWGDVVSSGSSPTIAKIPVTTVTFSATPSFDCGSPVAFTGFAMTLTGNVTTPTITANCTPVSPATFLLVFLLTEDATGGRTFSFPAGFSQALPINLQANAITIEAFLWDGTTAQLESYSTTGASANSQTGANYPIVVNDCGTVVTLSNGSAQAPTLPNANTMPKGCMIWIQNRGAGTQTITPATSTIDGAATLALITNEGIGVSTDGTNYFTFGQGHNPGQLSGTAAATIKAHGFGCTFDGGGAAISVKTCYIVDMPYACTIAGESIGSTTAETVTFKVWRVATGGTALPAVGNSINTSGISLSSGTLLQSTTVSDFTSTAIAAHDSLAINLTAVTNSQHVDVFVRCNQ